MMKVQEEVAVPTLPLNRRGEQIVLDAAANAAERCEYPDQVAYAFARRHGRFPTLRERRRLWCQYVLEARNFTPEEALYFGERAHRRRAIHRLYDSSGSLESLKACAAELGADEIEAVAELEHGLEIVAAVARIEPELAPEAMRYDMPWPGDAALCNRAEAVLGIMAANAEGMRRWTSPNRRPFTPKVSRVHLLGQ